MVSIAFSDTDLMVMFFYLITQENEIMWLLSMRGSFEIEIITVLSHTKHTDNDYCRGYYSM